jgi:hypothetical protein
VPSIGTVGDSYDNALAEAVNAVNRDRKRQHLSVEKMVENGST